ncbi:haspin protein kinase [Nematocida ausubeli]|uniref:Haspin protein kinase n=1 Tax=Nematocida ausubeli (strain ATCC PRA-371 / ERTm2) TaxID=1913371 RepID=H8ZEG9_NEMA1|nr:haspin protein kinase [Nematocida ausubeli]
MKIRTFGSKSKPPRKSLGVIAAPELLVLPGVKKTLQTLEILSRERDEDEKKPNENVWSAQKKESTTKIKIFTESTEKEQAHAIGTMSAVSVYSERNPSVRPASPSGHREDQAHPEAKKPKKEGYLHDRSEDILVDTDIAHASDIERKESISGNSFMNSEYIIEEANQIKEIQWMPFSTLPIAELKKLGESTFSEIYINKRTQTVYKIVPITKKKMYVKVEHTKIDHFIKECLTMERMNRSKYSAQMYNWYLVNERYPSALIEISRDWAQRNRKSAENIIPQANNSSGLFGVIEMEYCGCELEKLDWPSLTKEDCRLINTELLKCMKVMDGLQVEHRDLHQSNVLVRKTSSGAYRIKTIDYSLAHAVMRQDDSKAASVDILGITPDLLTYRAGSVLYTDIDRDLSWLFESTDDGEPHRKVYMEMNKAYTGNNRWRKKGDSNKFWISYLRKWMSDQIKKQS